MDLFSGGESERRHAAFTLRRRMPPGFRAFPCGATPPGRRDVRARAPHIRPIFGVDMGLCRSTLAFDGPSGSKICDRAVTGLPVRAYEADLEDSVVDALRW